jgi:hypothetical protein
MQKRTLRDTGTQETALMKDTVCWVVAPCRDCENRRFGGTLRLHLLLANC